MRDARGRQRLVRYGYLTESENQTGIGAVAVRVPRLRRSTSLDELLPRLYLKGVLTGDFSEALSALLRPQAPGLSASTISRLKERWHAEFAAWLKRDLSQRRYEQSE